MGLSRLKVLRCFSTAATGCLPFGRSRRAGSPGRIRNRAKLNDATRMMVSTAFRIFLTKYRRLSTALRARRTPGPERPRALTSFSHPRLPYPRGGDVTAERTARDVSHDHQTRNRRRFVGAPGGGEKRAAHVCCSCFTEAPPVRRRPGGRGRPAHRRTVACCASDG